MHDANMETRTLNQSAKCKEKQKKTKQFYNNQDLLSPCGTCAPRLEFAVHQESGAPQTVGSISLLQAPIKITTAPAVFSTRAWWQTTYISFYCPPTPRDGSGESSSCHIFNVLQHSVCSRPAIWSPLCVNIGVVNVSRLTGVIVSSVQVRRVNAHLHICAQT